MIRLYLLYSLVACKGTEADVGPANDAIPQKYRAKLHFSARDIESTHDLSARYLAPVPDGWRVDARTHTFKPTDTALFGDSEMEVSRHCGPEPCKVRDWNAYLDRDDLFASTPTTDERKPNGRFASGTRDDGKTFIFLAWWADGADHFDRCEALLDKQIQGAEEAFVKACHAVIVR